MFTVLQSSGFVQKLVVSRQQLPELDPSLLEALELGFKISIVVLERIDILGESCYCSKIPSEH